MDTLPTIRAQLSADCEPRPYGIVVLRLRNLLPIKQALLDGSRPWIKEHALSISSSSSSTTTTLGLINSASSDDAAYALARSNAFNVLLSDSLTQTDFGFGTETVFSLLTDTSPPIATGGGSGGSSMSRAIAAPFQLLNHFPNSPALTSKAGLIRSLNRHYAGSAAHVFDVIPMTYCISIGGRSGTMFAEQESPTMAQFVKRFLSMNHSSSSRIAVGGGGEEGGGNSSSSVSLVTGMHMPQKHCSRNMWIVKPAASGSSGSALIVNRIEDITSYALKAKEDFVIQKLIEQPLLVKGRKATVRLWALLTDSGDVYVYRAPLVHLANKAYSHLAINSTDSVSAADARAVHVVSEGIMGSEHSSSSSSSSSCETLSWAELGEYIAKEPVMSSAFPPNVLDSIIFPRMKRIIAETVRGAMAAPVTPGPLDIGGGGSDGDGSGGGMASSLLPTSAPTSFAAASPRSGFRSRRCFELFGVDFVLDEDLRPWLVSFSENPTLALHTPRHAATVQRMASELVRIAIDPLFPAPVPTNSGDDEEIAADTPTNHQRPLQRSLQFNSSNKATSSLSAKQLPATLTEAEQFLPTPGFSSSAYVERSVVTPTGPRALYSARVSASSTATTMNANADLTKRSASSLNTTSSPSALHFDYTTMTSSSNVHQQVAASTSSGFLMRSEGERGFEIAPGSSTSSLSSTSLPLASRGGGGGGGGSVKSVDFCFELVYRAHLAEDVETLSYASMVTAALSPARGGGGSLKSGLSSTQHNRSASAGGSSSSSSMIMTSTTSPLSSSLALAVQTQIKEALSLTLPPRTRPLHLIPLWAFLGPEPNKNKLSWMQDQDLRGGGGRSSSNEWNSGNAIGGGGGGSSLSLKDPPPSKLTQAYIHAPSALPPQSGSSSTDVDTSLFNNVSSSSTTSSISPSSLSSKKSIVAAAAQAAAAAASSSNPREALSKIADTLRASGLNHVELATHAPFLAALLEGGGLVLPPPPPPPLQVTFASANSKDVRIDEGGLSEPITLPHPTRRAWNAGTPISGQRTTAPAPALTHNTLVHQHPSRDWSKVAPKTNTGQRAVSNQTPKPPTVQQLQNKAQNAMTTQSAQQRRQRISMQQSGNSSGRGATSAVLATPSSTLAPQGGDSMSQESANTPNYLRSTDASSTRSAATIADVLAAHHSQQQSLQLHLVASPAAQPHHQQQQHQTQQSSHVYSRPDLSPLKNKELEAEALSIEKKRLENTLLALKEKKKKKAEDASSANSPVQQSFVNQRQPSSPPRPPSASARLTPPLAPRIPPPPPPSSSSIYAPYAGNVWVGESSSAPTFSFVRPTAGVSNPQTIIPSSSSSSSSILAPSLYRGYEPSAIEAAPSYEDMLFDSSVPRRAPALVAAAAAAAAAAKAAADAARDRDLVERDSRSLAASQYYGRSSTASSSSYSSSSSSPNARSNDNFRIERPNTVSSYSLQQFHQQPSQAQASSSTTTSSKSQGGGLSIAAMAAAALSARANGS